MKRRDNQEMAGTTILKVNMPWYPFQETYNLEPARYLLFSSPGPIIVVEGHVVNSYEELVRLASQEFYRNKEYLEVHMYSGAIGGG